VSVVNLVSIDLFRYGCIHLLPTIGKEDSISRKSSIDLVGHLQAEGGQGRV
jgi:hypothetical protein